VNASSLAAAPQIEIDLHSLENVKAGISMWIWRLGCLEVKSPITVR